MQQPKEVFGVLRTHAKYLFDFEALKFWVQDAGATGTTFIPRNEAVRALFSKRLTDKVCDFERQAAEQQIVQYFEVGKPEMEVALGLDCRVERGSAIGAVWSFPFQIKSATLVATIFSGNQYVFKRTDIPVLKILCESFFSKMLSLRMLEEVTRNQASLNDAYARLETKRRKIEELTRWQEQIIRERTAELEIKNAKLVDLVRFNAHNIREPLSRILGLAELMGLLEAAEIEAELLPSLLRSCTDLDDAIKSTISYIEDTNAVSPAL